VALLHDAVDSFVKGNHGDRNSVIRFGGSVMHNEEADVWLRRIRMARDRD
jgi:hypothetical protein